MRVHLAVRTLIGTTAAASWEIRTGSTPGRWRLMQLEIFLAEATASVFGLGRPAAIGVTPTTPVDFDPEDPNDVIASGAIQSALGWATPPTVPAKFIKRLPAPATVGSGIIWTWPEGLVIPVSSALVVWNITANALADMKAILKL